MSNLKEIDRGRDTDITLEEVKACPMFANFTDEAALEVINTIKRFSIIVYNFYENSKKKSLKKG